MRENTALNAQTKLIKLRQIMRRKNKNNIKIVRIKYYLLREGLVGFVAGTVVEGGDGKKT